MIFVLKRTTAGVHLERRQRIQKDSCAGMTSIHALFGTKDDFKRFCQADDLRFAYPLIYKQLDRDFSELFDVAS